MENKLTALDWVIKQINNKSIGDGDYRTINDIFKQAKEMEKQQIIEAVEWNYKSNMGLVYYKARYGKI